MVIYWLLGTRITIIIIISAQERKCPISKKQKKDKTEQNCMLFYIIQRQTGSAQKIYLRISHKIYSPAMCPEACVR